MVCKPFQRARSAERKAQRRRALLEATAELVDEAGVGAVSLSAIARRVGLCKSNIYTYFESREHILLELLHDDWSAWTADTEVALVKLERPADAATVAQLLTRSFIARPRLCQLASVVTSVLEKNVSEDAIVEFKTRALSLGIRAAAMLHATLPALELELCAWLLKPTFALVAGLWPMAHPPPAAAKVMERPEFAVHITDFERELGRSLELLLRGAIQGESSPR
jgi:AcrR family transcriptional regulator